MSFEYNGFLGKDIDQVRTNNFKNKQQLYSMLYDINRYCNKLKFDFPLREFEYKKLFVAGLYCKILQSYNSTIILSSYGLESDSKVILRSLVEAAFNLGAIIYSEDYFDKYIKKANYEKYQLLNRIKKNNLIFGEELVNANTQAELDELKDAIKGVQRGDYFTYKIAEMARMEHVYLYVYGKLSLDVHSNASVVEGFFDLEEGKIKSINTCPKFEEQDYVLITAVFVILGVLRAIDNFYSLGISAEIEEFNDNLKPYFQES